MNQDKYPVQNYVPYNPNNYLTEPNREHSLGDTLDRQKYERIINNPNYHFKNSFITNFDIIHHQCRGDNLQNTIQYYQTIFNESVNKEIEENKKTNFIAEAIESERKDVFLKKDSITEHFTRLEMQEKLEKQGIFLSSMRKRAFDRKKKKYTDDCNSVSF